MANFRELSIGKNGPDVENIQRLLSEKNYSTHINGNYNDSTEKAVKAFQEDMNLQVTGKVNISTLVKLIDFKAGNLDLGNSVAEYEKNQLNSYFITTRAFLDAKEGKKFITVGHKGAGKSAIFNHLVYEQKKDLKTKLKIL